MFCLESEDWAWEEKQSVVEQGVPFRRGVVLIVHVISDRR